MVSSVFLIISSILLVIVTLGGIVANGFIILINSIDWFRSRKLSANDQILTILGFTRMARLMVLILDMKTHFFSVSTHHCHYLYLIIPFMWIFTNTTSFWFGTWLSTFYLAKIATFSHPVFLQVKLRFPGLVPWVLLASIVFCAITAFIAVTTLSNGFSVCESNNSLLNISESKVKISDYYMYIDILHIAQNLIPLMIFLSSSILLLISLWMHKRRMQSNGTGTQDVNTQAHLNAIKALASSAVLYLSSFLAVAARAVLVKKDMFDNWFYLFFASVIAFGPSGHAMLLILVNTKLKQAWVRMLLHLKCCFSETPS